MVAAPYICSNNKYIGEMFDTFQRQVTIAK